MSTATSGAGAAGIAPGGVAGIAGVVPGGEAGVADVVPDEIGIAHRPAGTMRIMPRPVGSICRSSSVQIVNDGQDQTTAGESAQRGVGATRSARVVLRVAVLASGEGSNLQAIIDRVHGRYGVEVVAVLSDMPEAKALQRAQAAGIVTAIFEGDAFDSRVARDRAMVEHLRAAQVDLVVLAGYMRVLSPPFIDAFFGRIVNVHPSLLPDHPGLNAIQQALDANATHTGVTIHYVDEGVDTGPPITQETIAIEPGETLETLAPRVHEVEHRLLPEVIAQIAVERAAAETAETAAEHD
ncbi:MAG: phosphoribosylglycinamide formyltransferase [Solirubrobacterales bacterium]